MATMNCGVCGRSIGVGVLLCPFCHAYQLGLPAESTSVQSPPAVQAVVEAQSARAATAICPRTWCGQEYQVGAAVCPRCFESLPTGSQNGPRIAAVQLVLPGGVTIEVVPGRTLLIGRESQDARIADTLDRYDGVSRRHAELTVSATCATVTDLGSTNGTYVDGTRATTAGVPLESGRHQLRLGGQAVINVDVLTAASG